MFFRFFIIDRFAFYSCIGLEKLTLPGRLLSIEDSAFGNCDKLTLYVPRRSFSAAIVEGCGIPFAYV